MAEREYTKIAIGDIGTQFFWFNKDNLETKVTKGSFRVIVDNKTYISKIASEKGTKTFTATVSGTTTWAISGSSNVTLSEYGITVVGTVASNDTFTITYNKTGAFEYALPVTAGAEFGGDTESFDAPETDLDYIPKVGGRTSLNDIPYTINYTKEKYARASKIISNVIGQVYIEILQDGSCALFKGTSGLPSITAGDVRQITLSITPDYLLVIQDIHNLTADERAKVDALVKELKVLYKTEDIALYEEVGDETKTYPLIIDTSSIPSARTKYHASQSVDED